MLGDTHGTVVEDIRRKVSQMYSTSSRQAHVRCQVCTPDKDDQSACFREFSWATAVFENTTKVALGVSANVIWAPVSEEVGKMFVLAGDEYVRSVFIHPAYPLS